MHITYTQCDQSTGVATAPESHKDQNEPHQTWDNGNQHQSTMDLITMEVGAGETATEPLKLTVKHEQDEGDGGNEKKEIQFYHCNLHCNSLQQVVCVIMILLAGTPASGGLTCYGAPYARQ